METVKRNKGKSILCYPDEYVVIDIETTGLDTRFDNIIEVSAIRYKDGEETGRFAELSKPDSHFYLDDFITELTGITNEMLNNARNEADVLQNFYSFVGNDILVGNNVNFDINFIYDALQNLGIEFKNDYVDVLRLARRVNPTLEHHRQKDMAAFYNIPVEKEHRAEDDCIVCNSIFQKLYEDMQAKGLSFEDFKKQSHSHAGIDINSIVANVDPSTIDISHPLYNKSVCFTGALEKMLRKEALQIVANLGGIPSDSVSKSTNYLVLGNNDYCKSIKDGKSAKQKKAESLILKGADLTILSENAFYDLIEE